MSPVPELPSTSSSSCDAGHQESQSGSCSYDHEGTNCRTKSQEEVAVLEELNSLLAEARTFPVHSIITRILFALDSVNISSIGTSSAEDSFDESELISPVTVDEVFTMLEEIISLISPVEMSDYYDFQFDLKIDILKRHVKALSEEMDDDISLSTSGKDHECRLWELMDSLSTLSRNAAMAAVIRGAATDPLWSRLARVPDLEDLLPEDEEQCSVCTSVTINKNLNFAILSGCLHLLCESCALTWFEDNSTCPLCRHKCRSLTTRDEFVQFKREQRELESRYAPRRPLQHRQSRTRPTTRFSPY